ncbi:hypothetical protein AJ80_06387 [Polytolypa hystricis UAMH7299]|uniref:Uncharacterized protein n=1 Tax=Polytolypa hystricis (strain UAMH7299) TaxID=1447883 RepID=A0A2B7XXR9_POLH7|nr:hypothetical protein AJ80_06387 [Polytolypa hystricis UAMH7299]
MRICLDTDIQQLSDCHPEDWVRNAIEGDSLPAVKLLLEDDVADVNEALGYAIELRRVSIVDFLLDRGADPNIRIYAFVTNFEHSLSPVSYAGYSNDAVLMRVLLDHGLDVEDPDYDLRPIFWAIKYNNLDMARMLIYRGADISPQEYDLDWPLSQAIRFGRREIVQLLLDKGGPLRPSIDSEWLLRLVEDYGDEQVKQLFPHGLLDIPRN